MPFQSGPEKSGCGTYLLSELASRPVVSFITANCEGQANSLVSGYSGPRRVGHMKFPIVLVAVIAYLFLASCSVAAEAPKTTIYIEANGGFETHLAAAMSKKQVPVAVVLDKSKATYVLQASGIEEKKESTGSKVARCLFLYCAGIEDKADVSVQLLENGSSRVVWAYTVHKERGAGNQQSMAEAVAKHLKAFLTKPHD